MTMRRNLLPSLFLFDRGINASLELVLRQVQGLTDERLYFTYWLAQGPQFETAAEVRAIEKLGGHVVGMTMPRKPNSVENLRCRMQRSSLDPTGPLEKNQAMRMPI